MTSGFYGGGIEMSWHVKYPCDNSITTRRKTGGLRVEVFEDEEVAVTYVRCTRSCLYRSHYPLGNDWSENSFLCWYLQRNQKQFWMQLIVATMCSGKKKWKQFKESSVFMMRLSVRSLKVPLTHTTTISMCLLNTYGIMLAKKKYFNGWIFCVIAECPGLFLPNISAAKWEVGAHFSR